MLHARQIFSRPHNLPQTFFVKSVGRSPRRFRAKRCSNRDDVIFFGDILVNCIVGEASERGSLAGEKNFDLVRGGKLLDAVENISGLLLGQHSSFSSQHSDCKTLRIHLPSERRKHAFNFHHSSVQALIGRGIQEVEIASQEEMIFQFARGTAGDIQITLELPVTALSATFRNIRSD